jgi:hypothetical protein
VTEAGEQLRMIGIDACLAAAVSINRTYRQHAEAVITELIAAGDPFTADDVRRAMPTDLEAHHPNVLPSLLGCLSARGAIKPVDWATSGRRSRHASRNRVWIGGNPNKSKEAA